MPKQNITVNRYTTVEQGQFPEFAWAASIEPEDRKWILFVPAAHHPEVKPQLWLATDTRLDEETGKVENVYSLAPGSECGPCVVPGCETDSTNPG